MVSQMLWTWLEMAFDCGPKMALTPMRNKWHTKLMQKHTEMRKSLEIEFHFRPKSLGSSEKCAGDCTPSN